jgi:putative phosphoesterase
MVTIALVSDSHIPDRADEIPEGFWDIIENADVAVHAGDYGRKETFNALEEYSQKFYGVKGNCDFFDHKKMDESKTFDLEDIEIGVYHGTGITPRGHTPTLNKIGLKDLEVDILITGHTHEWEVTKADNLLILNPGSCTGVGGGTANPSNPSMMKLEIGESEIEVNLMEKKGDEIIQSEAWSYEKQKIKE